MEICWLDVDRSNIDFESGRCCFAFLLFLPSIFVNPGFVVIHLKAERSPCTQWKNLSYYSWKQKVVRGRIKGWSQHIRCSFVWKGNNGRHIEIVALELVALATSICVCVSISCSTFLGYPSFQVPFDKILRGPSHLGRYVANSCAQHVQMARVCTFLILFGTCTNTILDTGARLQKRVARLLPTDFCKSCEWSSPSHPGKCDLGFPLAFQTRVRFRDNAI